MQSNCILQAGKRISVYNPALHFILFSGESKTIQAVGKLTASRLQNHMVIHRLLAFIFK